MQLRPYQQKGIDGISHSFNVLKNRSVLFVLPTGGGKTYTFTYIAKKMTEAAKNVWILVHRDSLLKQSSGALTDFDVKHGFIKSGKPLQAVYNAQVASVWTLVHRLDKLKAPDLIIVDEAHHAVAGSWRKIMDAFPKARILGVTATPCRTDGKGLGDVFDDIIIGPTIGELIEKGFLVEPVVYCPPSSLDLSGVSIKMGDYNKKELVEAVNKPTITGDAVSHYKRLCDGVPGVAFCISINHAENVAQEFRNAGYTAAAVHGKMSPAQIDKILTQLGTGEINVVTSCDLISEGTDIPRIGCAMLLRPTHSEALYLQQVGRALRPCEGKTEAIILDHVANWKRHGLPTADRAWSLDAKKKKIRKGEAGETTIPTWMCEECFGINSKEKACKYCGAERKIKVRDIQQVEGDLVKIEQAAIKKKARMEVGRAGTLEELWNIAKERDYKNGWIWYKWKLKVLKLKDEKLIEMGFDRSDLISDATKERAAKRKYNTFISLKR